MQELQRWVIAFLVAITLYFAYYGYSAKNEATAQRESLQQSTIYLCSTVAVLDQLVVAAIGQIDTSFKDGTYARLKKQGILTQAAIDQTRQLLQSYRASHIVLSHTAPCQEVEG